MNDPQTATIETLAAEVRVLMLGNRQVTLSVYRQLDWVNPAEIDPFGRVHAGDKWLDHDGWGRLAEPIAHVALVGRAQATGSLVRSRVSIRAYPAAAAAWQALPLIVLAGLR